MEAVVVENRWGTNRLEAFSDGVFAIAITLLVLDIRVPPSEFGNLWHGIGHAWPDYLAYATSFVTIGGFWLVHHGILRNRSPAPEIHAPSPALARPVVVAFPQQLGEIPRTLQGLVPGRSGIRRRQR